MNLKVNQTGTLCFEDGSYSKVKIVAIDTYRTGMFSPDYWFEYLDEETHRPIIHPDFGKTPIIKSEVLLPEVLVKLIFVADNESEEEIKTKKKSEYEEKFEIYLEKNILPENKQEARMLFTRLKNLLTEEEIINEYFN